MINNSTHANMLISPARTIRGMVELYSGSTTTAFLGTNNLASFTVDRAGVNKFFGYGIGQELEVHILDNDGNINIVNGQAMRPFFGVEDDYISTTPLFYVTEVTRNENTNALTVKASDMLSEARKHTYTELQIATPYTVRQLANAVADFFNVSLIISNVTDSSFETSYAEGGNFGGDELLRDVLDAIADSTQTIYYMNSENRLVFKRLEKSGAPVITVDKGNYFTLTSGSTQTLASICHTTELGENLTSDIVTEGIVQYVRDNPLWNMRDDLATLLNNAIAAVGGLSIDPFNCEWRGNYLLEVGDKISIVGKEASVTTYLLNDRYTYNGGLKGTASWQPPTQEQTASNPTSIGDKINQTVAKVDKIAQTIDLSITNVLEEQENIKEDLTALQLKNGEITASVEQLSSSMVTKDYVDSAADEATKDANSYTNSQVQATVSIIDSKTSELKLQTDSISATVSHVETTTQTSIDALTDSVRTLTNEVNQSITEEELVITVTEMLTEGVDKVTTSSKKYTFDDDGLNISSSDSAFSTTITEEGMRVARSSNDVLVADKEGVKAEDLHATTYLIVGDSRFENWGSYTACFWIGV